MFASTRVFLAATALCGFVAAPVFAATPAASAAPTAKTAQQQRMTTCNKDATGKTGDARKAFMSSCLKGETEPAKPANAAQERMKTCNADASAKSLKGDARKAFMSTCLKSK
ncbi:PsiF family protein [Paralcaligenes sp. KSB-10]|uniref:PsiF family protein n=1 Tax=Paralcaligenes sp. KSB-10 TaxID=2901142 RepID=UPI001E2CDD79|nr:PsiF family protein [Paralcaligenes sp. KSB-10]UHL64005.1 PsiF family protein [Paralcaligenes sp. KSB-10]